MSLRNVLFYRKVSFTSINRRCLSTAASEMKDGASEEETDGRSKPPPAEPLKKPEGMVPKPYNRKTWPYNPIPNMIHEEFLNEGDVSGMGARLDDYYKMGDYVRQLKTPAERIEFVNPYERPWHRIELKWKRAFHPVFNQPRKAWSIPPVPDYFNTLDFYQYITKTRLITDSQSFDGYYKSLVPPTQLFEKRMVESLLTYFDGKEPEVEKTVTAFLRSTFNDAELSVAHNNESLRKYRVSLSERCESFWIRGGFIHMYEQKPLCDIDGEVYRGRRKGPRFIGDDKLRLGEISFVMRDKLAVQVRAKSNLPYVASFNQKELIEASFLENHNLQEDVIFSPLVYNLHPDEEHLWQCPGYEPEAEEPFKFGKLAIKNVVDLRKRFEHWRIPGGTEEYNDSLKDSYASMAITSLFNWLNGQAHCLGHTCYNDIEEPLVSQLILSDGQTFCFALAQLNTIAINVEMDGFFNRRSNFCLIDGPYNLYDEFDAETRQFKHIDANNQMVVGLNPLVLSRYLQMTMIGREA